MIILIFTVFITILTLSLFFNIRKKGTLHHRFSIVIACKNEEKNLMSLFDAIRNIDYPQHDFELILVDDHSTDQSFSMMQNFCLENAHYHALRVDYPYKGKKSALDKGIRFASFQNILLCDADCIPQTQWLKEWSQALGTQIEPDFVIAYSPENQSTAFRSFVTLITASNYASTCALKSPFSCTGRHLLIKKKTFLELGGYSDIEHIQSGDDKLLLNKFVKARKKIIYTYYPKLYTKPVDRSMRKNQDLRRFGKFNMSRFLWKVVSVLIAVFFLYLPYDLFFNKNYFGFLMLYASGFAYVFISGILHREKFNLLNLIFIIIYPYFLLYQSLKGYVVKWTWK